MFVTFNSLKYSYTLFSFLCTSYKILQSSSDICKTLAKHRSCKKAYPSFVTVFLEDFIKAAEGLLGSFSPLFWRLCFLNFFPQLLPHFQVKCIHFAGINNSL